MRGTIKFFDKQKGWGFITGEDGADVFVHFAAINGEGFKSLDSDDVVSYDVKEGACGIKAVNVEPILTRKMVDKALKEENLILKAFRNTLGVERYLVADINNVIQTDEQGMSLIEVAAYAGIDVSGLE